MVAGNYITLFDTRDVFWAGSMTEARANVNSFGWSYRVRYHRCGWTNVAPPSRFSKRAYTGTLVPVNAHAPLIFLGLHSTAGQSLQSVIITSRLDLPRCHAHIIAERQWAHVADTWPLTPAPILEAAAPLCPSPYSGMDAMMVVRLFVEFVMRRNARFRF